VIYYRNILHYLINKHKCGVEMGALHEKSIDQNEGLYWKKRRQVKKN